MNLLLINVPTRTKIEMRKIRPTSPPVNFASLLRMIDKSKHDITFLDMYAHEIDVESVEQHLPKKDFDYIFLGGIITTFRAIEIILPKLREIYKNSKIVLGGDLITSDPDLIVDLLKPDIAVIGEGEYTFQELVNTNPNDENLKNIDGIWFYDSSGALIKNKPREYIKDLEVLPPLDWSLIPIKIYIDNSEKEYSKRTFVSISSRGCPYKCIFCFSESRPIYRNRSAEKVLDEIMELIDKYNLEHITFLDENFLVHKRRIRKFCELYQERNCTFTWDFHTRVDNVDEDMLKLVKESGAIQIGYGIESGSQKMLDAMNKKITVEQAKHAVFLARKIGLKVNATFIFGMIGETKETMWETVKFCNETRLPNRPFLMTPYPGTPLYNMIKDRINNKREFLRNLGNATDLVINLTDFSDEELLQLREQAIQDMNDYYWSTMPRLQKYRRRLKLAIDMVKRDGITELAKRIILRKNKYKQQKLNEYLNREIKNKNQT